jgi:hypothetical protein
MVVRAVGVRQLLLLETGLQIKEMQVELVLAVMVIHQGVGAAVRLPLVEMEAQALE